MSRQELCIAVNRWNRFRSRPWGPNIPLRKFSGAGAYSWSSEIVKEKVRKAGVLHRGSASGRTVRSIAPVIGAGAFCFPGPQWTIVKQIAMPAPACEAPCNSEESVVHNLSSSRYSPPDDADSESRQMTQG